MARVIAIGEGFAKLYITGRDSPSQGKEVDERCVCCEGPHVFSQGIEGLDHFFLSHVVYSERRNGIDGKRVRVTVEVLDE